MLILSRKVGETIVVDNRLTITITRIAGNRVSVGISAPPGVRIVRGELEQFDQPPPPKNRLGESRIPPTVGMTNPDRPGDNGLLNHIVPSPH
jgi:carbon storage regulator